MNVYGSPMSSRSVLSTVICVFAAAMLAYSLILSWESVSTAHGLGFEKVVTRLSGRNDLAASLVLSNPTNTTHHVQVAWYLNRPGDQTPWVFPAFSTPWTNGTVGPHSQTTFSSNNLVLVAPGTYQLTAFAHEMIKGKNTSVAEITQSQLITITGSTTFLRASS
jgi:hypothetical protein